MPGTMQKVEVTLHVNMGHGIQGTDWKWSSTPGSLKEACSMHCIVAPGKD